MMEFIKNIFRSNKFKQYLFKLLVITFIILTLKDVVDLSLEYKEKKMDSTMSIVFNESMSFPNMTFCMAKNQAWSHFKIDPNESPLAWDAIIIDELGNMTTHDEFINNHWNYRLVVEGYQVIATLNSMERETTIIGAMRAITGYRLSPRLNQTREMIKKWLNVIQERNVTFEEFTQKVGFETIKRSLQRFQRLSFNKEEIFRTKIKITWLSLMKLCYQPEFDINSFQDIKEQGEFFIMLVSHNADNLNGKQVECMTLDMHGRPTDIARYMEGKGRTRDGFNDEICLGGRYEISVEINSKYIIIPNDEDGTACKEYKADDESEFNCKSRCRMEMFRDMCKCTPLTLTYLADEKDYENFPLCDYSKCIIDMVNSTYTDEECSKRCIPNCVKLRYTIEHNDKGRSQRPDLTQLILFWDSFEYLQLEQKYKYTLASFFAALGGGIGLWLGLSILSLIQLMTFITNILTKQVGSKLNVIQPKGIFPLIENKIRAYSTANNNNIGNFNNTNLNQKSQPNSTTTKPRISAIKKNIA